MLQNVISETERNFRAVRAGDLHGVEPYRGLGKAIAGLHGVALMDRAGWHWKTHEMPVLIQGKTMNKPAQDWKALVRGDNGDCLHVVSKSFKAHQNADMVEVFEEMAQAGGMEMLYGGTLDGGRKLFAVARAAGEFVMKQQQHKGAANNHAGEVDDKTELHFLMSGGHIPGTPFELTALGTRLWCKNGVRFTEKATAKFRLTHKSEFTSAVKGNIRAMVDAAIAEFETYENKARRMLGYRMDRQESELVVVDLLQPELLRLAVEKGVEKDRTINGVKLRSVLEHGGAKVDDVIQGRNLLERLMDADMARGVFTREFQEEENRPVRLIMENLETQPGAQEVGGTAWNTFNAVTYYVDHVRGRNADSGVESALFGVGDTMKTDALKRIVEYTDNRVRNA